MTDHTPSSSLQGSLREAAEQALGSLKALGAENGFAAEALRAALRAAPSPLPQERWHQVDYPKILYVCEICSESNSEACGNDRDHINVTPDGRWLCADCLDDEGIDVSVCRDAPKLFAALAATESQS